MAYVKVLPGFKFNQSLKTKTAISTRTLFPVLRRPFKTSPIPLLTTRKRLNACPVPSRTPMTLYYTFVFGILAFEMVMFLLLAMPVPSKFRKPITMALIKPFRLTQVQVAIKCVLAFILLLFIDTINRVYSINSELSQTPLASGVSDRNEVQSRKFYAQRNMYLTGITLFLTFTVFRTYGLVWELLEMKEKFRAVPNQMNVEDLQKQIEAADKEIASMKERAEGLQADMSGSNN